LRRIPLNILDFAESPEIKIVMAKVENAQVLFKTVKIKRLRELSQSLLKNEQFD